MAARKRNGYFQPPVNKRPIVVKITMSSKQRIQFSLSFNDFVADAVLWPLEESKIFYVKKTKESKEDSPVYILSSTYMGACKFSGMEKATSLATYISKYLTLYGVTVKCSAEILPKRDQN